MKKTLTKVLLAFISILFIANMAFAGETCQSKAAAKKLVGKAETSFIQKCETDTKAANAREKNMAGVAKNSLLRLLFSQHKI